MRVKRQPVLALLFLLLAFLPGSALAHAVLIDAQPKDGAVLEEPIDAVVLNFNEAVAPVDVRVLDASGSAITGPRGVRVRDTEMRILLPAEMPKGTYLVTYRVRSADSHPVAGSFIFSVGHAPGPPPMVPDVQDLATFWRSAEWVLRTIAFAVLTATCGGALFAVFVAGGRSRWLRRYVLVSAALTALTAAFGVGVHGALLALTPPGEFFSARPWRVGAESSVAPAAAIIIGGLTVIALAIRRIGQAFFRIVAILGAAIVAAGLTATGHVSAAAPAWLASLALGVHVLTVSFWIGALPPLLHAIRATPQDAPPLLTRFARLAMPNAVLLALSGFTIAYLQVLSVAGLVATDYGRMLLIKLALVAGLAGLAAFNRYRLLGRLRDGRERTLAVFRHTIRMELALALLVLGITAGLSFAVPPRIGEAFLANSPEAATRVGLTAEAESGTYKAQLTLSPGHTGLNTLELMVRDAKGKPVRSREITAAITKNDQGIEAFPRTAKATGGNRYQFASVPMPYAGRWQIRVDVRINDFEKAIFRFEVEMP